MREISVALPGREPLRLRHLVLDYNGTLAFRGVLLPDVAERMRALTDQLQVHVLTFDTFGTVHKELEKALPDQLRDGRLRLAVLSSGPCFEAQAEPSLEEYSDDQSCGEARAKWHYLKTLEAGQCCAVGNGANDRAMLAAAGLSIAVMGREGCFVQTLLAAMIGVNHINDALDLLLAPESCAATLRC